MNIDSKSLHMFYMLVSTQPNSSWMFQQSQNISKRQFDYHIEKLNNWLTSQGLPKVTIKNDSIIVPNELVHFSRNIEWKSLNKNFQFLEQERIYLLFIYTFIRKEPVSSLHYQFLLNISKNTATSDIKKANEFGEKYRVKIIYTRDKGFYLRGTEEDKRNLILKCISLFSSHPARHKIFEYLLLDHGYKDEFEWYKKKLMEFDKIRVVTGTIPERLFDFIYLLQMIHIRQDQNKWVQIHSDTLKFLQRHSMFEEARAIQVGFKKSTRLEELAYITIQLLGFLEGEYVSDSQDVLTTMTEKIINDFEKYACISIKDKQLAVERLYAHFKPAYYRMLYKIPITNPLLAEIKSEHATLFQFVQNVMKPIQEILNIDIPEDEIGYLTIHLGALLEKNQDNQNDTYRAVVVCPNGISSSLMLEVNLRSLFPNFIWKTSVSVDQFYKLEESSYDFVFSTVHLYSNKPIFIVKPILTDKDRKLLHHSVMQHLFTSNTPYPTPEKLLKIIQKYADIQQYEQLKAALTIELYGDDSSQSVRRKQPVLKQLITEEMIQFSNSHLEWEQAIQTAANPLLERGYIDQNYIDTMIKNVKELGPYMIIHPNIAIPHARPEHGVKRLGMSILKLETPTYLLNDEKNQVKIFICLAAIDSSTHLKALAQLTKLLSNKESLEQLMNATETKDILSLVHEYSEV